MSKQSTVRTFGEIAQETVERLRVQGGFQQILRDDAGFKITLFPTGLYQVDNKKTRCLYTFAVIDGKTKLIDSVTGLTRHSAPMSLLNAEQALQSALRRQQLGQKQGE